MLLANNGAIISNSKHYRVLLPYGIAMALSVYYLNTYLIDVYSMNGAALSTLLVIMTFNTIKVWYVNKKFDVIPFTKKTVFTFLIIGTFFFSFYFWNFNFNPFVNILLKSSFIVLSYVFLIYKLNLSYQITTAVKKVLYRIQSK